MVIVLWQSQFSTKIWQQTIPENEIVASVLKLGPLLLHYNEGVNDLVDCERMRKSNGNILPGIPVFFDPVYSL